MKEQLRATDMILKRGVRVKMRAPFFIRWIWPTIGLTVRHLYEGTMMRVSGYYLRTGLASEELDDLSTESALSIMRTHSKAISQAVACAVLNGYWSGKLLTRPLAWYMRWHCTSEDICTIAQIILLYGGVQDFMNTTRSVRLLKATEPSLGQSGKKKTKGS